MKNFYLLVALVALFGCRAQQVINHSSSDSTTVEVRERIVELPRIDTFIYEVPAQSKQVVVEDSSYLETDFATSAAKILPSGNLYHDLHNKEVEIQEVIKWKDRIEYKDSIVYQVKAERVEVPVKVPLGKVQRFLLLSGILAWLLAVACCLLYLRRLIN